MLTHANLPTLQPLPFAESAPVDLSLMVAVSGACTIYGWRNMTIVVWSGQATGASVAQLDRVSVLCRKRDPHGHSVVHIVHEPTQLPSAEARAGLAQMMSDNADVLSAMAIVVGGSGFWATAMRSVVTAMRMVGSRAFELRINGSIQEVVDWLPATHFARTGVKIGRDELLHALQHVERGQSAAPSVPRS
jgi:hypothetical protein